MACARSTSTAPYWLVVPCVAMFVAEDEEPSAFRSCRLISASNWRLSIFCLVATLAPLQVQRVVTDRLFFQRDHARHQLGHLRLQYLDLALRFTKLIEFCDAHTVFIYTMASLGLPMGFHSVESCPAASAR